MEEENLPDLLEVVLDLGRIPEARFPTGDVILDDREVAREDLDYLVQQIGDFGDDNRAGMERTLHRISAIRNRKGQVVGITCRAGRAVFGTIKIIEDLPSPQEHPAAGPPWRGQDHHAARGGPGAGRRSPQTGGHRRYIQRNCRGRRPSPTPPLATPAACRWPPPPASTA